MLEKKPDVYSVQYLLERKSSQGLFKSPETFVLFLRLVVVLILLLSVVAICVVLAVLYSQIEDKPADSEANTQNDTTTFQITEQKMAQEKIPHQKTVEGKYIDHGLFSIELVSVVNGSLVEASDDRGRSTLASLEHALIQPTGMAPWVKASKYVDTRILNGKQIYDFKPSIYPKKLTPRSSIDSVGESQQDDDSPDLMEVKLEVPPGVDPMSPEFSKEMADVLKKSFAVGEYRHMHTGSRHRRQAVDPSAIVVKITNISQMDGVVLVDFYIEENGKIVESQLVMESFQELTQEEINAALQAEVLKIRPLGLSSTVLESSPVLTVTTVHMMSTDMSSGGAVTPSVSASVTPTPSNDQLVALTFKKAVGVDIHSADFRKLMRSKLLRVYQIGKAIQTTRKRRQADNIYIQITNIIETPPDGVTVEFYVKENGNAVSPLAVSETFAQVTLAEQNEILAEIGQVTSAVHPVVPVSHSIHSTMVSSVDIASSDHMTSRHDVSSSIPMMSTHIQSTGVDVTLSASATVTPMPSQDNLVAIQLKKAEGVDVLSAEFKELCRSKLLAVYQAGKSAQTSRSRRQTDNVEIVITNIRESPPDGVIVEFYVTENGNIVSPTTVTETFDQVPVEEQNAILADVGDVTQKVHPVVPASESVHSTPVSSVDIASTDHMTSRHDVTPSHSVPMMSTRIHTSSVVDVTQSVSVSVTPTPSSDQLVAIQLKKADGVDVHSTPFRELCRSKLLEVYQSGKAAQFSRRRRQAENIEIVITDIRESLPDDVIVEFYVKDNGNVVSPITVTETFDYVPIQEQNKILADIGQVTENVHPVVPVSDGIHSTTVSSLDIVSSDHMTSRHEVSSSIPMTSTQIHASSLVYVTPSVSASVTPHPSDEQLVAIKLKKADGVDILSPEFKTLFTSKLLEVYQSGKAAQTTRRRRQAANVEIVITSIRESSPDGVKVDFYVKENGKIVSPAAVAETFDYISIEEQNTIFAALGEIVEKVHPVVQVIASSHVSDSSMIFIQPSMSHSDVTDSSDISIQPTMSHSDVTGTSVVLSSSHQVPDMSSTVLHPSFSSSMEVPVSATMTPEVSASYSLDPNPGTDKLLRIAFKLKEGVDIKSLSFLEQIRQALKDAYLAGRKIQQENQNQGNTRRKRQAQGQEPSIKIDKIFKDGEKGIVHFSVEESNNGINVDEAFQTFNSLSLEELQYFMDNAGVGLQLLTPGVTIVDDGQTTTISSGHFTSAAPTISIDQTNVLTSDTIDLSLSMTSSSTWPTISAPNITTTSIASSLSSIEPTPLASTSSILSPSFSTSISHVKMSTQTPVLTFDFSSPPSIDCPSTVFPSSSSSDLSSLLETLSKTNSNLLVSTEDSLATSIISTIFTSSSISTGFGISTETIRSSVSMFSTESTSTIAPSYYFASSVPAVTDIYGTGNVTFSTTLSITTSTGTLASSPLIETYLYISDITATTYTEMFSTSDFSSILTDSYLSQFRSLNFSLESHTSPPTSRKHPSVTMTEITGSLVVPSRTTLGSILSSISSTDSHIMPSTDVDSESTFPSSSVILSRPISTRISTSTTTALSFTLSNTHTPTTASTTQFTPVTGSMDSPTATVPVKSSTESTNLSSTTSDIVSSRPTTQQPESTIQPTPTTQSVTPTSAIIPPTTLAPTVPTDHSLARLVIKVKTAVDVLTPTFKAYIQTGLEKSYLEAVLFGTDRAIRRRREVLGSASQQYSISAMVTDTRRDASTPSRVRVDFYVDVNNQEMKAKRVADALNKLTLSELSAIITYPVLEPITAVLAPPAPEDEDDTLIVVLAVVIPSVLVILAVTIFLIFYYRHCDTTEIIYGNKETDTLGDHNLDVDIESGDIVKKSMIWKATPKGSLTLTKKRTPLAIEVEEPVIALYDPILMGSVPNLSRSSSFERFIPNPDSDHGTHSFRPSLHDEDSLSTGERSVILHPANLPVPRKQQNQHLRDSTDFSEPADMDSTHRLINSYSNTKMKEDRYMQESPKAFANVAKMGKFDLSDSSRSAGIPVKYRKVVQPISDTLIMHLETPRKKVPEPPRDKASRDPVSEETVEKRDVPVQLEITDNRNTAILEERAEIERWRNKQRQREKLRQLEMEKENGTGSNMNQPFPDNPIPEEASGERIKLGRNMRARPHRVDRGKTDHQSEQVQVQQPLLNPETEPVNPLEVLYFSSAAPASYNTPTGHVVSPQTNPLIESPQHPTQDLLETLNRQQQFMQRLEQEQRRAREGERIKSQAQKLINDTFLMDQIEEHQRKQERSEQVQQLLSDAFPLTGSTGAISNGGLAIATAGENKTLDILHSAGAEGLMASRDPPIQGSNRELTFSPRHKTHMNGHVVTEDKPDEMDPRLVKSIREEMRRLQPTKL